MATTSFNNFSGGAPVKAFGNESKPETKKNMFVEEFIKRPARSLIARPASRFGEMIGTLGLKGIDKLTGGKVDEYVRTNSGMSLDERLAQSVASDKSIPGFGDVAGVKGFGQGGGKQIAGEALEGAADIASFTGGTNVVGQTFKGTLKNAAATGFKTGAASGFGYGSGFALQEGKPVIESLLAGFGGASLGGPIGAGIGAAFPLVGAGVNKVMQSTVAKNLVNKTGSMIRNAGDAALNPANIMQRVARIPKGQQQKFQEQVGESVGEYLTKRNIYGDVPEITDQLFKTFSASKQSADDALAQLSGTYSPTPVRVALEELVDRETRISPAGVPSKDLARVQELNSKIKEKGLSMSEINEVKRLYERNVKTGYFKENNSDAIARSTNIDTAVREWQFEEAKKLGLQNLADINMETKAAKQLMDALGKEYYGTAGNNALGLTDYILLSGGDPQAVSMFLSKKVFGNKRIQSAIAKKLAGESDFNVQPEFSEKEILGLPAGDATRNTIKVAPKGANMESADKLFIVPGQTKKQAPQLKKEGVPSDNNTTLLEEAKQYKNAQQFVKAQTKLRQYDGGLDNIAETVNIDSIKPSQTGEDLFNETSKSYAEGGRADNIFTNETITLKKVTSSNTLPPIVVDNHGRIIDGNHRWAAAKIAGLKDIRVVTKSQLEQIWKRAHKKFGAEESGPVTQQINKIKDFLASPESKRGFIRNPLAKGEGKQTTKSQSVSSNNNTPYKETGKLTTKILKDLEGKTTVSKQYILDATNRGELKQVERDLIRDLVKNEPDIVNVADFANKVKAELLPLKVKSTSNPKGSDPYKFRELTQDDAQYNGARMQPRYEMVNLPDELRGNVANYRENIYESPIKTSAGQVHFGGKTDNYFGHTRIEDMADNKTRRVIEVQSDLYQKGNLDKEKLMRGDMSVADEKSYGTPEEVKQWDQFSKKNLENRLTTEEKHAWDRLSKTLFERASNVKDAEISKLKQYNDPTAHFRMIREEIKKASQDGKTKLQFPTGETAMKIEGLGEATNFYRGVNTNLPPIKADDLKVGETILRNGSDEWVIAEVFDDGKFSAIPQHVFDDSDIKRPTLGDIEYILDMAPENVERFDISGKLDKSNPIYRFYEKDVQKYLSKFGGKLMTDDKGVSWVEVPIKKEWAKLPVEAFALIGAVGMSSVNSK